MNSVLRFLSIPFCISWFVIIPDLSANEGIAYIENVSVTDTILSWEVHYERTDEWSADTISNVMGSSAACFNFNNSALTSPSIVIEPGCPLENSDYTVSIQIVGTKCVVDINFNPDSLSGIFPLNSKIKLFAINMQIIDPLQTAQLSWDVLNSGFFDNTDETINTTFTGSSNIPLPVELIFFTASVVKNDIVLEWKTETEVNNYGFEIQRSQINPKSAIRNPQFVKIGFVEGAGNSNSPKDYKFTDKEPTGGNSFKYRLKQIDNDGNFTYSKEVSVEIFPSAYELFQNYPNPFNPTTTIKFTLQKAGLVTLKVYDILGQEVSTLIKDFLPAGKHKFNFDASGFASGVYIYRLEATADGGQAGDYISTKKMTHLK